MSEADIASTILERLGNTFDIKQLVLFGSRARGEEKLDSDWDLLVIAESSIPFISRQGLAQVKLGKRDFSVDLLVYTPDEFKRDSALLGSAMYWADKEGRVLFAK